MPYEQDGITHYTVEEQEVSPDAPEVVLEQGPPEGSEASPWYFYACSHGASNTPCPLHHPDEFDPVAQGDGTFVLAPKPEAVKPDDWMKSYVPPPPEGITDTANIRTTE